MFVIDMSTKLKKTIDGYPARIKEIVKTLLMELELKGPERTNWKNYGQLNDNTYHCHVKKGRPTYVAMWKYDYKEPYIIKLTYVGTHEKAPYTKNRKY